VGVKKKFYACGGLSSPLAHQLSPPNTGIVDETLIPKDNRMIVKAILLYRAMNALILIRPLYRTRPIVVITFKTKLDGVCSISI
jgi:hypothetical protein